MFCYATHAVPGEPSAQTGKLSSSVIMCIGRTFRDSESEKLDSKTVLLHRVRVHTHLYPRWSVYYKSINICLFLQAIRRNETAPIFMSGLGENVKEQSVCRNKKK